MSLGLKVLPSLSVQYITLRTICYQASCLPAASYRSRIYEFSTSHKSESPRNQRESHTKARALTRNDTRPEDDSSEEMIVEAKDKTTATEGLEVMAAEGETISINPVEADQDISTLGRSDLITRINELEARLKSQTEQIRALTRASASTSPSPTPSRKPKKPPNVFDPSAHHTRHIALKLSYLGTSYNGFEHTNNIHSAPPLPTVEEVLWKALRKARLISPEISDGADKSYEVVWNANERARQYGRGLGGGEDGAGGNIKGGQKGIERLELNWEGCQWSKCGRTDKGVSAFGQVVGVRVRSNRPMDKRKVAQANTSADGVAIQAEPGTQSEEIETKTEASTGEDGSLTPDWDPIRDEIPYISVLNNLLPPSIKILAWCPHPPDPEWDARFFAEERRYKYFFTNPAFCPTPGPLGWKDNTGQDTRVREGWLDIEAMRVAAKKLEGLHDFRNVCKIDASKQMTSCERRITFADITEFDPGLGTFVDDPALMSQRRNLDSSSTHITNENLAQPATSTPLSSGPKLYAFTVHGTAFLWHQVRCMAAILFLIGQGLESPSLIDTLLDVKSTPGRPNYEMADDTALVLWDCVFPGDNHGHSGSTTDAKGMNWTYAGDKAICSSHTAKGDGKFGIGGVVENLFSQWRAAKLSETLSAGLLGLALRQGDGSPLRRGGLHDGDLLVSGDDKKVKSLPKGVSQKVFNGSETPRLVGKYVSVMERTKAESLDVLNEKYLKGKQARRDVKKAVATATNGGNNDEDSAVEENVSIDR